MTTAPTDRLAAALAYLRRGWSVIPLLPDSKDPAIAWTEFQQRRMTEVEATAHWTEHPDYGVGVVTGAISDLVVVDIGPDGAADPFATSKDCPTGYAVATGGGGLHLYCRHPGVPVSSGTTGRAGIARCGDGSYVVAPPSRHPDGSAYLLIEGRTPGVLPSWVMDSPAAPESAAKPAVEQAPLADAVASIVAACRSAKDRIAEDGPGLAWLIPGVLPRGALVSLTGNPSLGTSTLLAQLVHALLEGSEFLGHQASAARVLWFTDQPRATFKHLLRARPGLVDHPDLIVLHHHEVLDTGWSDRVAGLRRAAMTHGVEVLVLDSFHKLAGLRPAEAGSSATTQTALDTLDLLRVDGLTILLVSRRRPVADAGDPIEAEADLAYTLVTGDRAGVPTRLHLQAGRLDGVPDAGDPSRASGSPRAGTDPRRAPPSVPTRVSQRGGDSLL